MSAHVRPSVVSSGRTPILTQLPRYLSEMAASSHEHGVAGVRNIMEDEIWFGRWLQANEVVLNNGHDQNPNMNVRMVGLTADLQFAARTKYFRVYSLSAHLTLACLRFIERKLER